MTYVSASCLSNVSNLDQTTVVLSHRQDRHNYPKHHVGRMTTSHNVRVYATQLMTIIIIITTTIFIVLSCTAPAICESSLWFLWAKVGQRQVAADS